jgi:transposase
MKTFALTTALALSLAAPAFASDQIARSLGLEPGVFTAAELAAIKGRVEDRDSNDAELIAALKSRTGAGVVSTRSVPAPNQVAANLGLDAGQFTASQVATIKGRVEERDSNDAELIAELKSRTGAGVVSTRSVPAPSQVAASLGLDAGQFTAAEIARIKGLVEERETSNAGYIASLIAR